MSSSTPTRLPSLGAALPIGFASQASAQAPPNGSFVATLGRDTVAFESYTWSGDTLSGTSLTAYPTARVRSYRAVFGTDGRIRNLHLDVGPSGPSSVGFAAPEWGSGRAELGPAGDVQDFDMTGSTTKYLVARVPEVDLAAREKAWAARPQPGSLSPRDTASARIGDVTVTVDYGRPSMRGREVFGGIVPWGRVWRTGANAATRLITDHELVIGGQPVPAGTYSLWTIPARDGWTLVINRQHGQWGTEYHPDRDLVRVPLTMTHPDRPVERFTITVADGEAGEGSIAFAWERTRARVEVRTHAEP